MTSSIQVGAGAGAGYNINIPWPHGGVGDKEYLAAFESIVMPIARAFDPQVVRCAFIRALISALIRCLNMLSTRRWC